MASAAPCTPEALQKAAETLGFSLSQAQLLSLATYLGLLEKWNRVMNLVGRANWQDIFNTLIVDSLHLADLLRTLPIAPAPLCRDLGAGAGLPGIPLRMLWQEGSYALVEAREKRALFLRTVLASCDLPGVSVFQGRAEAYMAANPHAQLTVSRAFMPWKQVLQLIGPYTEKGGLSVFLTRIPLPKELPEDWQALGDTSYQVQEDTRYLWALQKR